MNSCKIQLNWTLEKLKIPVWLDKTFGVCLVGLGHVTLGLSISSQVRSGGVGSGLVRLLLVGELRKSKYSSLVDGTFSSHQMKSGEVRLLGFKLLNLFTVKLFIKSLIFHFYRPQRSWVKVMFLQASVILLTGEGSASVHAGIPLSQEQKDNIELR